MPIFQNCLPDNKLGRDRIFSVRELPTHDWRDVRDGIPHRARELCTDPQWDKAIYVSNRPLWSAALKKKTHHLNKRKVYGCADRTHAERRGGLTRTGSSPRLF